MRKIATLAPLAGYFLSAASAFAQESVQIRPPNVGYTNISSFINAAIQLIFIVAIIAVLVMLIWGGAEWILSGGDKDGIDKARKRITNALIGLAIIAVAFAIASLAGTFVGIDLFRNLPIPRPGAETPLGTR